MKENKKDIKNLLEGLVQEPHRKLYPNIETDKAFLKRLLEWLYQNNFETQARILLDEIEKGDEA